MSNNQQEFLENLQKAGWKTLVSNDYDEIVMEIMKYFVEVRFKCQQCTRAFKTKANLQEHENCTHAKKKEGGNKLTKSTRRRYSAVNHTAMGIRP